LFADALNRRNICVDMSHDDLFRLNTEMMILVAFDRPATLGPFGRSSMASRRKLGPVAFRLRL